MNKILKEFWPMPALSDNYLFGAITGITLTGVYQVKLTTGIVLTIRDILNKYVVGDQVILNKSENLSNIFILKKVDKFLPPYLNYVVGNDLS